MELKYGFVSCDDHDQEHPEVWTKRMSKTKWGDRVPHIEREPDGSEPWIVDGKPVDLGGVAIAAAAMPDRARVMKTRRYQTTRGPVSVRKRRCPAARRTLRPSTVR